MKLYNVRIAIGSRFDFYRYVIAPSMEAATKKAVTHGAKKAKKDGRDGAIKVLSIVELTDEIIR